MKRVMFVLVTAWTATTMISQAQAQGIPAVSGALKHKVSKTVLEGMPATLTLTVTDRPAAFYAKCTFGSPAQEVTAEGDAVDAGQPFVLVLPADTAARSAGCGMLSSPTLFRPGAIMELKAYEQRHDPSGRFALSEFTQAGTQARGHRHTRGHKHTRGHTHTRGHKHTRRHRQAFYTRAYAQTHRQTDRYKGIVTGIHRGTYRQTHRHSYRHTQ